MQGHSFSVYDKRMFCLNVIFMNKINPNGLISVYLFIYLFSYSMQSAGGQLRDWPCFQSKLEYVTPYLPSLLVTSKLQSSCLRAIRQGSQVQVGMGREKQRLSHPASHPNF